MWTQIYDWAKWLFTLAQDARQNRDNIKRLTGRIEELTEVVEKQDYELRRMKENQVHEREKLMLQIENAMLKFERRLLSDKSNNADG